MNLLQLLLVLGLTTSINGFPGGWDWMYPSTCEPDKTCLYMANWDWDSNDNCVTFTVAAKQSNTTWAGIGFTRNNTMENADLLYGYINSTGDGVAFEGTWIPDGNNAPVKNPVQNFCHSEVYYKDEFLWVVISKPRFSPNVIDGFNFTDTDCYFPLFPIGGGSIVDDEGTISKPNDVPKTTDLICFNETKVGTTGHTTVSHLTMETENTFGINGKLSTILPVMNTTASYHDDEITHKWKYPANCVNFVTCVYMVKFKVNLRNGTVTVHIAAKQNNGTWTGVGYTNTSNAAFRIPFIYGFLREDGTGAVFSGIVNSTVDAPEKSIVDKLLNSNIWSNDGYMNVKATFKRDLINTDCPYVVFPVYGGKVNDDGSLEKPDKPMMVTNGTVCIHEVNTTKTNVSHSTETPSGINKNDDQNVENTHIWKYPANCVEDVTCDYSVSFIVNLRNGTITVLIAANQTNGTWTGVGYTRTRNAELRIPFVYGFLRKDGTGEVFGGMVNTTIDAPEKDKVNHLFNSDIWNKDGYIYVTATFGRDIIETVCPYVVFPVYGGKVNDDGSLEKPEKPMMVTNSVVCIHQVNITKTNVSNSTETPSVINNKDLKKVCLYSRLAPDRKEKAKCLPEDIDPMLCTHLILSHANISEDHMMIPADPKDAEVNGLYDKIKDLKKENSTVKTLLAVRLTNTEMDIRVFTKMLETIETRQTFINSSIELLRNTSFDGLDIFVDVPKLPETNLFTLLIEELSDAFKKEAQKTEKTRLLLVLGVSGISVLRDALQLDQIHQHVEFIDVEPYNLNSEWNNVTQHPTPLFSDPPVNSVFSVMNHLWPMNIPKNKFNVGVAAFGIGFTLANASNNGLGAPVLGPSPPGEYTNVEGLLAYYEICPYLNDSSTSKFSLADELVPYLTNNDTWIGYEDEESLTEKVEWLKNVGYGGWFFKMIDFDDCRGEFCGKGTFPVLKLISKILTGGVTGTPPPLSKILHSTESLAHSTETVVTQLPTLYNVTESLISLSTLPGLGICNKSIVNEIRLYVYPGNCTMYVNCTLDYDIYETCPVYFPYFEPRYRRCTTLGYLTSQRKNDCKL